MKIGQKLHLKWKRKTISDKSIWVRKWFEGWRKFEDKKSLSYLKIRNVIQTKI